MSLADMTRPALYALVSLGAQPPTATIYYTSLYRSVLESDTVIQLYVYVLGYSPSK